MTTIAYDYKSGVIACDGRVTQGSYITHDFAQKWLMVGDEAWFFTGSVADRLAFISYHNGELSGRPEHEIECAAFIAIAGKCFEAGLTRDGEPWRVELLHSHATGSGRDHAVAAMDHGKGAIDAVKYASTRDTCTGGKISALDLAAMKFMVI